jgi:hypothetical protein
MCHGFAVRGLVQLLNAKYRLFMIVKIRAGKSVSNLQKKLVGSLAGV